MSISSVPKSSIPFLWKLALLLPATAHAIGLGLGVFSYVGKPVEFGRVDLAVLLLVLTHVAAIPILAATRRRAFWYLLGTYVLVAALLSAEFLADRVLPSSPNGLPRLPIKETASVGEGFGDLSSQPYQVTVNSLGLRGPEIDFHGVDLAILCVGGGTTACTYTTDVETWPWALQDELEAQLDKAVFVGNASRRFYTTINIAQLLRHYTDPKRIPEFDWVVVLCGFDDWGNKLTFDEAERLKEREELPIPETLTYPEQSPLYYRNTGLLRLLKRRSTGLDDPTGQWVIKARSDRADQRALGQVVSRLPEDMAGLLKVYQLNLRAIRDTCRARGSKLLLLTQPTLYQPRLPREAEDLLWKTDIDLKAAPSLPYLYAMNQAYNKTLREFCKQNRVECIDLDALVPKDAKFFYDDCHLTRAGCAKVADILTEFFVQKLGAKKPE